MSSTTASIQDSPIQTPAEYEPINGINGDNEILIPNEINHEQTTLLSHEKCQSSIVTIFAIWNMMMGTSLLSMPWAYAHAGILGGLITIFIMGIVCFYTASLVLTIPKSLDIRLLEYGDLVRLILGPIWCKLSQLSSISILAGGCIVYWILMNNFAINIVTLIYEVGFANGIISTNASSVVCHNNFQTIHQQKYSSSSNSSITTTTTTTTTTAAIPSSLFSSPEKFISYAVPTALLIIQGPIICLRSVSIFLKFNFFGTFSVFFLIAFAAFKSIAWGIINVDFKDSLSPHYVPLFSMSLPIYTGVLSLALFIHNCLTTIMKTQAKPQHNYRDLAIAYCLVVVTYLFLGIGIYVSFPLNKNCLRDNFLDNLESNDIYAFFARTFLFIQIFALFPLLCFMVRVQVLSLFPQQRSISDVAQSSQPSCFNNQTVQIILLNILLLIACVLFGFFYPQIGSVIRYCGSFSGLILTFTLPPFMLIFSRRSLQTPIHWTHYIVLSIIIIMGFTNFALQFIVKA